MVHALPAPPRRGTLLSRSRTAALAAAVALVAACSSNPNPAGDGGTDPDPDVAVDAGPGPAVQVTPSTRNDLLWKRYRAFEQGLGEALNLAPNQICEELGRYDCIEQVHLVALGGNDPFLQGMHEPLPSPTATTPVAVERLILSACDNAVDVDATRGVPLVFLDLNLATDAPPLDLSDQAQSLAVDDTITSLYRRLLARDPLPAERAVVRRLVEDDPDPMLPRELALLACYVIGTTAENVFF